jgi:Concanavalin A-like lectin/glucanases superfamily
VVGGAQDDFSTEILNGHFAGGTGNPDLTLEGTSSVITGRWVHVASTRRAETGELTLVVNGILEASAVSSNRSSLTAPYAITFGGHSPVRGFIGLIDEVRIWNVVRSPEQIAAGMRQRLLGDEPGLVGYYRSLLARALTTSPDLGRRERGHTG